MKNVIFFAIIIFNCNCFSQEIAMNTIKNTPKYEDLTIYSNSELSKKAEFVEGSEMLFVYISEQYRVPKEIKAQKIKKTILIKFIVEANGELTNFDTNFENDQFGMNVEAIRVLKSLPNWKPAQIKDKKVRSQYNLAVLVDGTR